MSYTALWMLGVGPLTVIVRSVDCGSGSSDTVMRAGAAPTNAAYAGCTQARAPVSHAGGRPRPHGLATALGSHTARLLLQVLDDGAALANDGAHLAVRDEQADARRCGCARGHAFLLWT